MIPFDPLVRVGCVGHGQVFGEACWEFVETVCADAFSSWQVVAQVDADINCVFVEPVGIWLHCGLMHSKVVEWLKERDNIEV